MSLAQSYKRYQDIIKSYVKFLKAKDFFKQYPKHYLKKVYSKNKYYYDFECEITYNTVSQVVRIDNENFYLMFKEKQFIQYKIRYDDVVNNLNASKEEIEEALNFCFQ